MVLYEHTAFVHSSTDGYLSCFHLLATMHNAALNIHVHDLSLFFLVQAHKAINPPLSTALAASRKFLACRIFISTHLKVVSDFLF